MLTSVDVRWQVEKLRLFIESGGDKHRWFKSKDFCKYDRERIEAEMEDMLCQ